MRWFGLTICLLAALSLSSSYPRVRRQVQLHESSDLDPLSADSEVSDDTERDKRTLEAVTQSKYGVKNAILGLIFGKINSIIDAKTRLVDTLDKQNIAKNKQYGIEVPQSSEGGGFGNVISSIIGPKLQLLGPKIGVITNLLGSFSGGSSSSSSDSSSGGGGSGLGSILRIITSLSGSSGGGGGGNSGTVTLGDDFDDSDEDEDEDSDSDNDNTTTEKSDD